MASLEVSGVTVAFGGNRALDGVDLTAERGKVTGLIGPNGAGKSTLFDVICGLRRPSTGVVHLDGRDVTRMGPARRAKHGLARTFQRLELFGRLSVRDNLLVAAELGPDRRHAAHRVAEILSRLSLAEHADTPADSLPTGLGRLAEVGRALAVRPKFLLLDEPAAGQDGEETERFAALLRALADDGTAGWIHVEPGTAEPLLAFLQSMRFLLRVDPVDVSDEFALLTLMWPDAAGGLPDGAPVTLTDTFGLDVRVARDRVGAI